jgi:hypothetical protein
MDSVAVENLLSSAGSSGWVGCQERRELKKAREREKGERRLISGRVHNYSKCQNTAFR